MEDLGCFRAVWAAVITTAIKDMDYNGPLREAIRQHARNWLFSNESTPQSFLWICEMLDLDGGRIQTLCLTREGRAKIVKPKTESKRKHKKAKKKSKAKKK